MLIDVLQRSYPEQVCSIARALEVVGERWTLLILRDARRVARVRTGRAEAAGRCVWLRA